MENSKNLSEIIGEQEGVINGKEELREFIELFSMTIEREREEIYSLLVNKEGKSRWSHQEIAEKLIDVGFGGVVTYYLANFSRLNHQTIANKLFEAGNVRAVADNLENFTGLDKKIADKLIKAGYGWAVANNLGNFSGLDHQEIAEKLIKARWGGLVANNLGKLSGLDKEIVLKFLNYSDQEIQIIAAKSLVKRDLRKEKNLKPAEGILVLEILKALEMDFYVLLSECWAGKTTAEDMRKQCFDFEIENIDHDRQQELNNQIHALVMAAEKIIKEKGREKFDELKGKYNVDTEKQKIINEWSNHHRELEDQAGNLLRNIVNEGLRKAYIEWREDEVNEWFIERDKVA